MRRCVASWSVGRLQGHGEQSEESDDLPTSMSPLIRRIVIILRHVTDFIAVDFFTTHGAQNRVFF